MEILLSFERTADAIHAEALLLEDGLCVRVMSLPASIRAGCGIGLRLPPEDIPRARSVLAENGLSGFSAWRRHTLNGQARYTPYEQEARHGF